MATGGTYTAGKLIPRAEVQLWALCSYEIPTLCSLVYSKIIAIYPFYPLDMKQASLGKRVLLFNEVFYTNC